MKDKNGAELVRVQPSNYEYESVSFKQLHIFPYRLNAHYSESPTFNYTPENWQLVITHTDTMRTIFSKPFFNKGMCCTQSSTTSDNVEIFFDEIRIDSRGEHFVETLENKGKMLL